MGRDNPVQPAGRTAGQRRVDKVEEDLGGAARPARPQVDQRARQPHQRRGVRVRRCRGHRDDNAEGEGKRLQLHLVDADLEELGDDRGAQQRQHDVPGVEPGNGEHGPA